LGVTVADRTLFTGVNVTIPAGDRLLIVGENGTGKPTLLHTLAGVRTPDAGVVRCSGSLTLVRQGMDATGTVGDLVADATAASDAPLADLDQALTSGDLGDAYAYADALDRATTLDGWDAHRHVDIALAGPGRLYRPDPAAAEPLPWPALPGAPGLRAGVAGGHPAARRADQPPGRHSAGLPHRPADLLVRWAGRGHP
ncbi:MAG: ATP-binding cassette domain-containing protein, partial [Corynebacterium variabile]|nr:ATP-binding cassette domain-containing protein [Corynebacterium variabile]